MSVIVLLLVFLVVREGLSREKDYPRLRPHEYALRRPGSRDRNERHLGDGAAGACAEERLRHRGDVATDDDRA